AERGLPALAVGHVVSAEEPIEERASHLGLALVVGEIGGPRGDERCRVSLEGLDSIQGAGAKADIHGAEASAEPLPGARPCKRSLPDRVRAHAERAQLQPLMDDPIGQTPLEMGALGQRDARRRAAARSPYREEGAAL